MTHEEFDNLIQKIEQRYQNNAAGLQRRVLMWVAIGYGWFFGWMFAVLAMAGVIIHSGFRTGGWAGMILFVLAAMVLVFGLAIVWHGSGIRITAPEGRRIKRAEAPVLFQEVQALRRRLKTLRFHTVILTSDFNAGVSQVPKLGIFGWWRNYLLLGMPLLELLSAEEFRAVLAHEFAHLSRKHGRLGHWLYRLRLAWFQMFAKFEENTNRTELSFRKLSALFVRWFWPRFNAHAFVLSRVHEYEADRVAGEIVGNPSAIAALIRVSIVTQALETKFWPDLRCMMAAQAAPVSDFVERLVASVEEERLRAGEYAMKALQQVSTNDDTHPCLTQRVTSLRWNYEWPDLYQRPEAAASVFLGKSLQPLREAVNSHWQKEIAKTWRANHEKAAALQSRLNIIDKSAGAGTDVDLLWDKAAIRIQVEGLESAEPLLRQVLKHDPFHVRARFYLGRSLLLRDEKEGLQHLEHAVQLDEDRTLEACDTLVGFYRRIGDSDGIRSINRRMDQFEKTIEASQKERQSISAKDEFLPHEVDAETIAAIAAHLGKQETIKGAWLVKKKLTHFLKHDLFALSIELFRPWFRLGETEEELDLLEKLARQIVLPGRIILFTSGGTFRSVDRKMRKVKDAQIYRRPEKKT